MLHAILVEGSWESRAVFAYIRESGADAMEVYAWLRANPMRRTLEACTAGEIETA